MFIWSVNPGKIDAYKYILLAISVLSMVLLFRNIFFKEKQGGKKNLFIRLFSFTVLFNALTIVISHFLGGVISMICGVIQLIVCLRIADDKAETGGSVN